MKKKLLSIIVTCLSFPLFAIAQSPNNHTFVTISHDGNKADTTYVEMANPPKGTFMSELPHFNGNLRKYYDEHMHYPADAKRKKKSGTVMVTFNVDTKGKLSDIAVEEGVYPSLDSEAVRLVRAMPPWKPAMHYKKPIQTAWFVDVPFDL